MFRTCAVLLLVFVTSAVSAQASTQEQRKPARETWNQVFTESATREWQPNKFLAERIRGRKPGRALDIGMGEGRNAIYLASLGWEVTGLDISDVAIKQAQARASQRGMKIETVLGDVDTFDYGQQKWDLVIGMYMHAMITRNANKIVDSLKPGGSIIIEGFHRDLGRESVQGGAFGYTNNELPRAFDALRVVFYEDTRAGADWNQGQESPIVRFEAVK
jgi:2-polyprenyl-3-methyl-5-hydroxy-6-metoxy-1,4-benzoquinol methylase